MFGPKRKGPPSRHVDGHHGRASTTSSRRPSNIFASAWAALFSPAEDEDIWHDLWHQEAHHSTALEGNTLILDQVRKVLDEGQSVGDKEYAEVLGHGNAARWVYGQALDRATGPTATC
jgi:hypothetical protein